MKALLQKFNAYAWIAAVLAMIVAMASFQFSIANPMDVSWIQADAITTQFGWHQYLHDPNHIYPLVSDRFSWPLAMPNAIFGTLPILDLPLKLLAPLLPDRFQYLGPVYVLGAGLQALVAWALLREAVPQGKGSAYQLSLAIAALLFGTAPVLLVRFYYGHTPLALQWPLLLSMLIYLRSYRLSFWRTIRDYSLLVFVTAGINPYTLAMVGLIYGGFIIKAIFDRTLQWQHYLFLIIPLQVGYFGLLAFGFIDLQNPEVLDAWGFGFFSANFLTLIDPGTGYFGSEFIPDLGVAGAGQYEGFGYLGLGVIVLLVVSVVVAIWTRRDRMGLPLKILLPLIPVIALSYVWAMSNVMAFGSHVITLPVPGVLEFILQAFRSSGRFIQVVVYLLMFIAIVSLLRRLPPRRAAVIFIAAGLLQFLDLARPLTRMHEKFVGRAMSWGLPERFADPAYSGLEKAHNTILVMPPWQCHKWLGRKPAYPATMFWKFSNLAMDSNLRTNSFYGGREPVYQMVYHCQTFPKNFNAKPTDLRTAYIVGPDDFAQFGKHISATHLCDFADDMFICRGDAGAPGLSGRAQRTISVDQAEQRDAK